MWLQDGPGRVWDGGPTAPLKGSYCPAPPPSGTINYGPQSTALSKIKSTLQSPLPKAHTTYPPPFPSWQDRPPPLQPFSCLLAFLMKPNWAQSNFFKRMFSAGEKGKRKSKVFSSHFPLSLQTFTGGFEIWEAFVWVSTTHPPLLS